MNDEEWGMIFEKRSGHTETVVPGGVFVPRDTGLAFTKTDVQVADVVETVDGGGMATVVLIDVWRVVNVVEVG